MSKLKGFFLALSILSLSGCGIPHYFWPQDDVPKFERGNISQEQRILVASRKSEFKSKILQQIKKKYQASGVYLKVIGIEDLEKEKASIYKVVIILNTLMGWDADPDVRSFLKANPGHDGIIILTTSGDPDWNQEFENEKVDAISAASEHADPNAVAQNIIQKIDAKLK